MIKLIKNAKDAHMVKGCLDDGCTYYDETPPCVLSDKCDNDFGVCASYIDICGTDYGSGCQIEAYDQCSPTDYN